LGYKGYRNYQRNDINKESNINLTFSDSNSKFKKLTYSDSEFEFNNSLLKLISKIKDSITTEFLNKTEGKILFFALDKDTLNIKKVNRQKYSYSSRLDKEMYDKNFNDLLFNSLEPLLSKNGIDEIEVYTLTPTEYSNIPPPPGTIANFDYKKE
jgi:predicted transcriptional regulator